MAFLDKLKGAVGTKAARADAGKKPGYSRETKQVLSKVPGSEVKPEPKARKEWTDTAPDKMAKTGKRPEPAKTEAPKKTSTAKTAPSKSGGGKATSSFGKAFAAARKAGKKNFSWNGKTYHTKLKEEM